MIKLHKLTKQEFVLNAELIQSVESTPDTTITLLSGLKYSVRESLDEVIAEVAAYKRSIAVEPLHGATLAHDQRLDDGEQARLQAVARETEGDGLTVDGRGKTDRLVRGG